MDHIYYSKLWFLTQRDLEKLIEYDQSFVNEPPIEDRNAATNYILELYFRYRKIVQRLTVCHDNIVHPQIRQFIQKMLDYSIIRMLEIRQEMVDFTFADYPWPIDILLHLHWTIDDVDLTAPIYNLSIRMAESERRKKLFEDYLAKTDIVETDDMETTSFESDLSRMDDLQSSQSTEEEKEKSKIMSTVLTVKKPPETEMQEAERKAFNDAVLLIQSNERSRVGRRNATNALYQIRLRKRLDADQFDQTNINENLEIEAAIKIQKIWRGFSVRRQLQQRNRKIQELLRMTFPSGGTRNILKRLDDIVKEKSDRQAAALRKLKDLIFAEEEKFLENSGPSLVDDIREEIRTWLFEWYEKVGFFDYIPSAAVGGSTLIATGQCRTPTEYLSSAKPEVQKSNIPESNEENEVATNKNETEGWVMRESKVISSLMEINKEFLIKWNPREIQILDPTIPLIEDFIFEDICYDLQLEMREIADESMRVELEDLNVALMTDHQLADDDFQFPKPQEFDAVEEVNNTNIPVRDILPDKSDDDLAIELMRAQVIRNCPERRLSDWPGVPTYNFQNYNDIHLGDIKHAVMDYCVLPLGSKSVHQLAPLVRSVCICGPPGSGQLFIAHAICNELKATVFDLTPEKHKGRYKSKKSQNRLVDVITRLTRAFAPSIVLVEGEKAWLKQVPPTMRRLDPKRFSPLYRRIVNGIEPGDQVLFLTTSTEPYLADKSFVKLHDKFIIIPVADYSTTFLTYKKSLLSQHAIPRNFPVSSLAKAIAKETPLEFAQSALDECLKIQRRIDFKRRPLKPMEIFETLQNNVERPTKNTLQLFENFRANLPLEKKRREFMQIIEETAANSKK